MHDQTILEPPQYVDDGQRVLVRAGDLGLVDGVVTKAAGTSAEVSIPALGRSRWCHISELRVRRLLTPSEQLRALGWREADLPKARKRRWVRPWRLDDLAEPAPVTILKACDMAGVAIQ